jgi:hypothetical protein
MPFVVSFFQAELPLERQVIQMTTSTKAPKTIVEVVSKFAEVKAEIKKLEAVKAELTTQIMEAFGDTDLLTHYGVEVARRDWRSRDTLSGSRLQELIAIRLGTQPELAEIIQKMIADSTNSTVYPVIVNLYR